MVELRAVSMGVPTYSSFSSSVPPPSVVAYIDPEIKSLLNELAGTEGDPYKLDAWDLLGTVSGTTRSTNSLAFNARKDLLQALLQLESHEWADQNAYLRFKNLTSYYQLTQKAHRLDTDPRTHNRVLLQGAVLYLASQEEKSYLDVLDALTTEPNFSAVIGDSLTELMGGLAVESPDPTRGWNAIASTFVEPLPNNDNSYTCFRPQALWREGSDGNLWGAWRSTMAGVHTSMRCGILQDDKTIRSGSVDQAAIAVLGASGARLGFFLGYELPASWTMNLQGYPQAVLKAEKMSPDNYVLADVPTHWVDAWRQEHDGRTMVAGALGSNDTLAGTATGPYFQNPQTVYTQSLAFYRKQGKSADIVFGAGAVSAVNMLERVDVLSAGLTQDAYKAPPVFYTLREGSLYQATFKKRDDISIDWRVKTASVNGVTYKLKQVLTDGFTRYRLVKDGCPLLNAQGRDIFVMYPKDRMSPLDYARFAKGDGVLARLLYDKTAIQALDRHMSLLRDADLHAMEQAAREDPDTMYLHIQATEVIEEFIYMDGDRDNGVSLRAWLLTSDFAHPSKLGYDLYYLGLARRLHMEAGLYREMPEVARSLEQNYQALVERVSKALDIPLWMLERYRTGTDVESQDALRYIQGAIFKEGRAGHLTAALYNQTMLDFAGMALAPVPGLRLSPACTVNDLVTKPICQSGEGVWPQPVEARVDGFSAVAAEDKSPREKSDKRARPQNPIQILSQLFQGSRRPN